MKNETLDKIREYYRRYEQGIFGIVLCVLLLIAGISLAHDVGYKRGLEDAPLPEYEIQTFSIEMNTTTYNQTYYSLTRHDLRPSDWVVDLEPRDDYWMIGISIIVRSEECLRFFLRVESREHLCMMNSTVELVSITTLFWFGDSTQIYNFYGNSTGGINCRERAMVYFLGYGTYQGVDAILSNSISIESRKG